ncbi:MAG: hypothetical protein QNJ06_04880 [Kiloniellales bacterium]|nr:hypothetical protein [Kiloniellales bacterium]MDJ0969214.1 hypothetical protein [Kiloniellales bacterium]MDJ0981976.1 hypothetical protein [Kiloniellales bacterium]
MIGHKKEILETYKSHIISWTGQVWQGWARELHALQVSHQDAAFLATTKGDAYQHLMVRDPVALRV